MSDDVSMKAVSETGIPTVLGTATMDDCPTGVGTLGDLLGGVSAAMGAARISAVFGPCAHKHAVPVELLVSGERVACICTDCLTGLPVEWLPDTPSTTPGS